MNSQMWGYNEFHSALLKHSDQVSLTLTKRVHFYTPGIFVDISTQLTNCAKLQPASCRFTTSHSSSRYQDAFTSLAPV